MSRIGEIRDLTAHAKVLLLAAEIALEEEPPKKKDIELARSLLGRAISTVERIDTLVGPQP